MCLNKVNRYVRQLGKILNVCPFWVDEQKKYCPEVKYESHGMRMLDLGNHLALQTRKLRIKKDDMTHSSHRVSSLLSHEENTCPAKAVYPTISLIFNTHCAFELLVVVLFMTQ